MTPAAVITPKPVALARQIRLVDVARSVTPTGAVRGLTGFSRSKLYELISVGVLTNATPKADRGRGRDTVLWLDEVEILMRDGEAACRDYRQAKGRR